MQALTVKLVYNEQLFYASTHIDPLNLHVFKWALQFSSDGDYILSEHVFSTQYESSSNSFQQFKNLHSLYDKWYLSQVNYFFVHFNPVNVHYVWCSSQISYEYYDNSSSHVRSTQLSVFLSAQQPFPY